MLGIVIAFPNRDNAVNIRNILVRNGIEVLGVCTTGAQVLSFLDNIDEGVVICGYKLKDVMYTDLRDMMPKNIDMLLIASEDKWEHESMEGVVGLSMPIKIYDLMNTMEMMLQTIRQRRRLRRQAQKKRDPRQEATIKKAKLLLMERNHMTEEEAHRYIQKNSMDSGNSLVETAEMVLTIMGE